MRVMRKIDISGIHHGIKYHAGCRKIHCAYRESFNGNCRSLWKELFVVELCSVILAVRSELAPGLLAVSAI